MIESLPVQRIIGGSWAGGGKRREKGEDVMVPTHKLTSSTGHVTQSRDDLAAAAAIVADCSREREMSSD